MNIDAISAVSDAAVLPEQIGAEVSSDVVDGADLSDFQAAVQQLNNTVIADAVVDPAVDCVVQPDDAEKPESYDSDGQASFATYLSSAPASPPFFNSGALSWSDVRSASVTSDQWQPDASVTDRAELGKAGQRPAASLSLDATPSPVSADEPSLSVPASSAIRQSALSVLSGMHNAEQPTIAVVTASSNGASFSDCQPGSTPWHSSSTSSSSLMTSSLPLSEMLIAGGQHHARAVAHLPSLGTVQVEMTRASASEVAVHVHASALSVTALERCSATLQQLVAGTVQPAATSEAGIKETSYAPVSEFGIKVALSFTSQNQSQADSGAYQQQGRAESSRPVVEQLTLPVPVTALVDLLI